MSSDERVQRLPEALVAAAQRGDAAAQARLFDQHKASVAAHVQRMTGDPSAVDDLVQEVFIAAFTALPGFRGDAQFGTWLYRIAVNKVRNYWDSDRRRRRREDRSLAHASEAPSQPDESYEQAEHRERLYAAMDRLPHKLREAFVARAVEGMSLAEASEALGAPVSTVSYRTRRAEALLVELLELDSEVSS